LERIFEELRDLQDITNILWETKERLTKQNEELSKRLDKRDNDIADSLIHIQEWIKQYQPTLDEMKTEKEMLDKARGENVRPNR
jgi:hypothetical protein